MTVSYTVNNQKIDREKLKELQITKKDYIDFIESIKKNMVNLQRFVQELLYMD